MGTELIRVCIKEENDDIPSVPPGFESFAAFTLRRVQDVDKQETQSISSSSVSSNASELQPTRAETDMSICDTEKVTRSLRRKPLINYGQLSTEDEPDSGKINQNPLLRPRLPKGVIRGCPECSNCQKVSAKWRPEYSCRPALEDAPVFYPTEEEFKDTLRYISSIRPKAEPYGICRIVPPPSWKPPCPLREKTIWEGSKFATRVQRVDKLQNRDSMKKSRMSNHNRKKRRRCMRMAVDCGVDSGTITGSTDVGIFEPERFGFDAGPDFTLNTFQKYADDFKAQYFRRNDDNKAVDMTQDRLQPTLDDIEGEYWRVVEKATEEIEVLYGADLETGVFGSGFPKRSSLVGSPTDDYYVKSGWNLNNFPRLPGSVLSYESGDISGVLIPWLYIGMCFSSFCWHVEDHHLYSLNYMHLGAPKMWYGVPGKDAIKLEEAMRKHLPDLFEEQPDLLHKLVTQLSPSILKSEGVPVYRCVQNSGEFVLTFPRAYHAGFNCGFNCAEAVNVAPVDWLPHGQIAIELYCNQGRRTSVSHDKLLLGAARDAVRAHWELNLLKKNTLDNLRWKEVCGRDGILAKALKTRVEMERVRRELLSSSSRAMKMASSFDATCERECTICLFDLHLSAAGCGCSPDKYACLNHAKQLCSCASGTKYVLYRYDISELDILVEALEGKLSAVYRWARLDLGLALTSDLPKDNMHGQLKTKSIDSPSKLLGKGVSGDISAMSAGFFGGTPLEERKKLPEAKPLNEAGGSTRVHSSVQSIKEENHNAKLNEECSSLPHTDLRTSVCQLAQEDMSYALGVTSRACGVKNTTLCNDNIILLSDDEEDELPKPVLEQTREYTPAKREIICGLGSKRASSTGDNANMLNALLSKGMALLSTKPNPAKHPELPESLSTSGGSPCNGNKDPILISPKIEETVLSEKNIASQGMTLQCTKSHSGAKYSDSPESLSSSGISPFTENKDPILTVPKIDRAVVGEKNANVPLAAQDDKFLSRHIQAKDDCCQHEGGSLLPDGQSNNCSPELVQAQDGCHRLSGAVLASNPPKCSFQEGSASVGFDRNVVDPTNARDIVKGHNMADTAWQHGQPCGRGRAKNEDKMGPNATSSSVDNSRTTVGSPSCSQNNLDRYFRQKGPRIAKVVRRINCNVEALEFGVVVSGKLWCNNQAIFPKGFRSRVKYISVVDPASTCYYISEILQSGRSGPLFMVSLEDCPSEVFVHVSAGRCWEMVRERVNQEISKQHKMGRMNLPPLQPPGSLDGLEMFGFSSPAIVQAIEALDRSRVCTDYWDSRPYSRPEGQIPHHPGAKEKAGVSLGTIVEGDANGEVSGSRLLPDGVDSTLRGLFKKASLEELGTLSRILNDKRPTADRDLLKLLDEEINDRPS
ncbi:hypothetical protein Tsubulata_008141 [Turnera subulata]|uniref:JmjC domain-containing protein n=1 Tax=Turnera subulata TaxID=218843 RepID=A0A9Q0FML6_9ROSI|nr:hypothetical protein Tsubulata_008141 [Turnera subulata]